MTYIVSSGLAVRIRNIDSDEERKFYTSKVNVFVDKVYDPILYMNDLLHESVQVPEWQIKEAKAGNSIFLEGDWYLIVRRDLVIFG